MRTAHKDIVFGAALLVLSLAVLFWLIPVGIDSPGKIRNPALAPAFWPRLIMIGMTALSVILIAQGVLALRRSGGGDDLLDDAPARDVVGEIKMLVAAAVLFVFAWSMTWGGIVVPSMAALIFYMALHGERRVWIILPVAIGLPVALYLFFLEVAQVPMPLGVFEDLIR